MTKDKRLLTSLFERGERGSHYRHYGNSFEHIVRQQSVAAIRNFRPRWFYRLLTEETNISRVYRESNILDRKYAEATPILMYIEHSPQQKPLRDIGVDTKVDHIIKIDIAEAIRLGEFFNIDDSGTDRFPFHFYLPSSGDLYEWNEVLYEIDDLTGNYFYEPLQRWIVWEGSAKQFIADSAEPDLPVKPKGQLPAIKHPLFYNSFDEVDLRKCPETT